MTDNEIVKALGCCRDCKCKDCPCYNKETDGCKEIDEQDILDLINRLKAELERKDIEIDILIKKKDAAYDEVAEFRAEIERLQKAIKVQDIMIGNQPLKIQGAKKEAIKELAEKLKEYFPSIAKAIDHTAEELIE